MREVSVPASWWRRLMAGVYDGLLLFGIWVAVLLVEFGIRQVLLGLELHAVVIRLFFFLLCCGFFGWFWTHGGQTLGMRAWRLHVRRLDGSPLTWPFVPLRVGAMLATWCAALAPVFLLIPHFAALAKWQLLGGGGALVALACLLFMVLDSRRRAFCDLVAGTEVIHHPPADRAAPAALEPSA